MNKTIILLSVAIILFAAAIPVSASDVVIGKDRIKFFIGTYDAEKNIFVDYSTDGWAEDDPMSFTNKVSSLPQKDGAYFGFAPWYTNMANAILEIPEAGIVYASMVDLKKIHKVQALMTKWVIEGENLRLVCVTKDFAGLQAAPTIDGSFMFPDSTRFLVARCGGGDMVRVWRKYIFALDNGECGWKVFYTLDSNHLLYEPEFTEAWCIMDTPVEPNYTMKVYERLYQANGGAKPDGSYSHIITKIDTTQVSLWEEVKKLKK
ncbi:MAG: hypothetical protein KAR42_07520 [candidate division Zixibacteria bacterium]|nr:hypothetical protein [candidate division Zixibacteria bacterium]